MTDDKLCLSREEIAELTRAHTRARQVAFLRNNGIRHYVDNNGWPVVTIAAVDGPKPEARARAPWKPNKAAETYRKLGFDTGLKLAIAEVNLSELP